MEILPTTLGVVDEFLDRTVRQTILQQYLDHVKMDEYMDHNQIQLQQAHHDFVNQE